MCKIRQCTIIIVTAKTFLTTFILIHTHYACEQKTNIQHYFHDKKFVSELGKQKVPLDFFVDIYLFSLASQYKRHLISVHSTLINKQKKNLHYFLTFNKLKHFRTKNKATSNKKTCTTFFTVNKLKHFNF